MFYYSATRKLVAGENIQLYNYGNGLRDFTYIDDIVEGVFRVMQGAPISGSNPDTPAPYALYNIGGGNPVKLLDFVDALQNSLVKFGLIPVDYNFEAHRKYVAMQPGDMLVTFADCAALERDYGFHPSFDIYKGLPRFVQWYRDYYKLLND